MFDNTKTVRKIYQLIFKYGFEIRDCNIRDWIIDIDIADPDGFKRIYHLERYIMRKISKRQPPKISAGAVIVRLENGEYKFLMLRSGNYWEASAKGKIKDGEEEFDGALREIEEETTLTPDQLNFKWGRIKYQTEPYAKGKAAIFYIAETKQKEISLPINPEIGKAEHNEYRWLTYEEAHKIAVPRIKKVIDWANTILKQ